jgi:hypothetical protein
LHSPFAITTVGTSKAIIATIRYFMILLPRVGANCCRSIVAIRRRTEPYALRIGV